MSVKQTIDYDPVEEFLEVGRRALAAGELEEARFAFNQVLQRRPDDPRALLGLAYVERQTEPPPPGGDAILLADLEVVALVRQKQYDAALELLQRLRLERPDDKTLRRSETHIRAHIERRWVKQLGGREARLEARSDVAGAFEFPLGVADVLESPHSFESLRTLIAMHGDGQIVIAPPVPLVGTTDEKREDRVRAFSNPSETEHPGAGGWALMFMVALVAAVIVWFLVEASPR